MTSISVLIASPDASFRARLRCGVAGHDEVCEADDQIELLRLAVAHHLDIVLLDEAIDAGTGPPVLPQLHAVSPDTHSLLFADVINDRLVLAAADQGADGCLSRDAPPTQWLQAMDCVLQGGVWMSRRLLLQALEKLLHEHTALRRNGSAGPRRAILTERQREVIRCITQGLSNKQIARRLGISPTTVKTHLQTIFARLNISGRLRLVARCADARLDQHGESVDQPFPGPDDTLQPARTASPHGARRANESRNPPGWRH